MPAVSKRGDGDAALHQALSRLQSKIDVHDAERAGAWAFLRDHDDQDRGGQKWRATAAAAPSRSPF